MTRSVDGEHVTTDGAVATARRRPFDVEAVPDRRLRDRTGRRYPRLVAYEGALLRTFEHRWVSLIDSQRWRRVTKSETGQRLFKSRPYRAAQTARRFATTWIQQLRDPCRFSEVDTLCIFIGHVKSGATLVGSLLDAHPNAIVADEIDVMFYVSAGFRREQIFHLLEKGSRREMRKGRVTSRQMEAYSFAVPLQWQGRSRRPRVIGDSKAGPTTRRFGRHPALLRRLDGRMGGVRPKFIHVVRHPLDPISATILRGRRSFDDAIGHYARQARTLDALRAGIGEDRLLTVAYEEFVHEPLGGLTAVCEFLGLDADPDYLAASAGIIHPSARPERLSVDWGPEHLASVDAIIDRTPFLERYRRAASDHGN